MKMYLIIRFAFLALVLYSASSFSNVSYNDNEKHAAIGELGESSKVSRIIKITMLENMFLPSEINVKQGETIQFIVKNGGNKKHEMIIDTKSNLKKYAKMRRNDPEMNTIGKNHIRLDPDERKTLIWKFTKTGTIDFACPLPGHFKGMRGKINVEN